jgi:hypothetical protein
MIIFNLHRNLFGQYLLSGYFKRVEIMVDKAERIICPHCNSELDQKDIHLIMFKTASVLSCPVCKKTISLQPKNF